MSLVREITNLSLPIIQEARVRMSAGVVHTRRHARRHMRREVRFDGGLGSSPHTAGAP